ncbi:MAG: hypothetical protein KGL04_09740 [Elusimicrobia bacterium]|nr:hypothetical protein [Elusimicrobiota bacterium]
MQPALSLRGRDEPGWRSTAKIMRYATSTPASALALSRGRRGRAGMTAVP